ncbi:MAG: TlyA family RNA methyltransferase [Promethearchaeota archaeon]
MKERLDILLVDRRLVEGRTKAQWLIRNGYVLVNGKKIIKPGKPIDNSSEIKLIKEFPYVGRGGLKLEVALKEFMINVKEKVCIDIGASIGGFTDCLLKHGALKVYAVDTAKDLIHPSLLCEKMKKKVIPLLGIDARKLDSLEELVEICTIDITFASLREILPNLKNFLKEKGDIIALVKPLFEIEFNKQKNLKNIYDFESLRDILQKIKDWAEERGFFTYNLIKSPILGKGGAIEFFIHFRIDSRPFNFNFKKKLINILEEL